MIQLTQQSIVSGERNTASKQSAADIVIELKLLHPPPTGFTPAIELCTAAINEAQQKFELEDFFRVDPRAQASPVFGSARSDSGGKLVGSRRGTPTAKQRLTAVLLWQQVSGSRQSKATSAD